MPLRNLNQTNNLQRRNWRQKREDSRCKPGVLFLLGIAAFYDSKPAALIAAAATAI
jgi:hypothetical protein